MPANAATRPDDAAAIPANAAPIPADAPANATPIPADAPANATPIPANADATPANAPPNPANADAAPADGAPNADERDCVLVLTGPDAPQSTLAAALSGRYAVVHRQLSGDGADEVERIVAGLNRPLYALVGIAAAAAPALRLALERPELAPALVLVSPEFTPGPADAPGAADSLLDAETLGRLAVPLLAVPLLAVFGMDDPLAASGVPALLRERAPNGHICFVYAAGHNIENDRPEALANVVSDYLERRETFVVETGAHAINP